jgi:type IV secretion system protein VirB6
MKKCKTLAFLLLAGIFFTQSAHAIGSYQNDSCAPGISLANRLIAKITTLGLFATYSRNFTMSGAEEEPHTQNCAPYYYPDSGSNTPIMHHPDGCTGMSDCGEDGATTCDTSNCAETCNSRGGMRICYRYINGFKADFSPTYAHDCNWVTNGWNKSYLLPPAAIRVNSLGDKICAQFWTILGWQAIGCKYVPDCSVFNVNTSCFVAQSCSDNGYRNSKGLVPITSMIMQCIYESVARLFIDTSACATGEGSNYKANYFPSFQNAMRNAVRAASILYVILFGIKMAMGGELPSKGEFFYLAGRYILVLYFSIGISMGTTSNANGQPVYSDGIMTYMLPLFQGGSQALVNIIYSSAGARGLCAYDPATYPPNTTSPFPNTFGYLALWDSLDCRILYYLGMDLSRLANLAGSVVTSTAGVAGLGYQAGGGGGGGDGGGDGGGGGSEIQTYAPIAGAVTMTALLVAIGTPTFLTLILPAFLSFQIVFAVFTIAFAIFLISIVMYLINVFVLCTIGMTILIYMAPIFVPMVLFQPTKGYYEGWLKLLCSYALQPLVISSYMALMLTVFDQTMFGNCQFSNHSIPVQIGNSVKEIPFFLLCDPDNPGSGCLSPVTDTSATPCKETIGYQVNPIRSGSSFTAEISAVFFKITILKASVVGNMLSGLITLCLFGYLFYKFAEMLGEFAAEITSGTNVGSAAGNPMALVEKAAGAAKAGLQYATGDKKGAAKTAAKTAGATGKKGRGSVTPPSTGGG